MFDKPVEEVTEWVFYNVFKRVGGDAAVGTRQSTGRKEALAKDYAKQKKEKEL